MIAVPAFEPLFLASLGDDGLHPRQKTVAILVSILLLVVVVELVRKRKLREEYSVLWMATAVGLLLLAWNYRLLSVFQQAVGIVEPQFALFFGALLFLVLIALQFSVRLSKLTYRNKSLTQRIALLERELVELRTGAATAEPRSAPPVAAAEPQGSPPVAAATPPRDQT
jgi:hypothetical protein